MLVAPAVRRLDHRDRVGRRESVLQTLLERIVEFLAALGVPLAIAILRVALDAGMIR
jgi:hypothetical protein